MGKYDIIPVTDRAFNAEKGELYEQVGGKWILETVLERARRLETGGSGTGLPGAGRIWRTSEQKE